MPTLLLFADDRPPQWRTDFCGAAALACAGRFLQRPVPLGFGTPAALAAAVSRAGLDLTGTFSGPVLVSLARAWGMRASTARMSVARATPFVLASIRTSHPALVQWRPWKMGLDGLFDRARQWSVVAGWPDEPGGQVVLTDSVLYSDGTRSGYRFAWTLDELTTRGGLSRSPVWVFLS